jgi:hypothetical protein
MCSFEAGGFSCSLDVLHGGPGINLKLKNTAKYCNILPFCYKIPGSGSALTKIAGYGCGSGSPLKSIRIYETCEEQPPNVLPNIRAFPHIKANLSPDMTFKFRTILVQGKLPQWFLIVYVQCRRDV